MNKTNNYLTNLINESVEIESSCLVDDSILNECNTL